jgi:S-methylmethionine-dependent homocysteine/selenocysteine methylase
MNYSKKSTMSVKNQILETIKQRPLIIDGAMGTQLQAKDDQISEEAWEGNEGCNEILNVTAPEVLESIYSAYLTTPLVLLTGFWTNMTSVTVLTNWPKPERKSLKRCVISSARLNSRVMS